MGFQFVFRELQNRYIKVEIENRSVVEQFNVYG
ncbi:hypothetical protein QFZ37_001156 [Chryseobacterium ginsenosidimutans]|nr:hypothetical protein [Chryseobacterium ginsenosidimutans]